MCNVIIYVFGSWYVLNMMFCFVGWNIIIKYYFCLWGVYNFLERYIYFVYIKYLKSVFIGVNFY